MPLKKGANAPYKDLTKNTVVLYFETEYGCMLGLKKNYVFTQDILDISFIELKIQS